MPLRGLMDDRPVGLRVYKIDREYVHLAVQQNYLLGIQYDLVQDNRITLMVEKLDSCYIEYLLSF